MEEEKYRNPDYCLVKVFYYEATNKYLKCNDCFVNCPHNTNPKFEEVKEQL